MAQGVALARKANLGLPGGDRDASHHPGGFWKGVKCAPVTAPLRECGSAMADTYDEAYLEARRPGGHRPSSAHPPL